MKIIDYFIVPSILINFFVQLSLIMKYYFPLIMQYFQNKKINWNSNFDRVIAASFLAFFYLSFYLGRILLTSSNELYLAILYMTILILLTIAIYLIQRMGFAERVKNNLIPLKEPTIKTFKHLLNDSQHLYLFNEFKKNEFISADFYENDLSKKFLEDKIKLTKKVTSVILYHIYINFIENIKVDKGLTLKNFVPFFITYKNEIFKYGSVRNGSQSEYSKEIETIEAIFKNIPK